MGIVWEGKRKETDHPTSLCRGLEHIKVVTLHTQRQLLPYDFSIHHPSATIVKYGHNSYLAIVITPSVSQMYI